MGKVGLEYKTCISIQIRGYCDDKESMHSPLRTKIIISLMNIEHIIMFIYK